MAVIGAERYSFTLAGFLTMHAATFFEEGHQVDLLDGQLADRGEHSSSRLGIVRELARVIHQATHGAFLVRVQEPLAIGKQTAVIPDVVVLRQESGYHEPPIATDTLLVVEVIDTTSTYDRAAQLSHYADADITEAWLFDLVADRFERHTDPRDGAYQQVTVAERGQQIASTMLPDLVLAVNTILGPREGTSE